MIIIKDLVNSELMNGGLFLKSLMLFKEVCHYECNFA